MEIQERLLKKIPAVHEIIKFLEGQEDKAPASLLTIVARKVTERFRRRILQGLIPQMEKEDVFLEAQKLLKEKMQPRLRPVINATGVVVHTNLGRSLLAPCAIEAIKTIASRYSNLEFDLLKGKRGSRYSLVEELLCELTGAEAALVVNNNAAAVLLTLNTLAQGREVIVSRGELVEIGGAFRIPDVMARSGAILKEIGTTNRTHLRDYEKAIGENTALLMKVHQSNFAILGFTKSVSGAELVALARKYNLPVVEDLGSGSFIDFTPYGLPKEPTVQEAIKAGIDVVSFSGDKLLGGPQAGIILGKKNLLAKIKKNPINRAVRIDKLTLASLEATLRLYRDEKEALKKIPTLYLITLSPKEVLKKARKLIARLKKEALPKLEFFLKKTISRVGGGALPLGTPESYAVVLRLEGCSASKLESLLREQKPPIIARIEEEQVLLDMRTVLPDEIPLIVKSIKKIVDYENEKNFHVGFN